MVGFGIMINRVTDSFLSTRYSSRSRTRFCPFGVGYSLPYPQGDALGDGD